MPDNRDTSTLQRSDAVNQVCPWSGDPISDDALTVYREHFVGFCNTGCRDKFAAAISMFDAALTNRSSNED